MNDHHRNSIQLQIGETILAAALRLLTTVIFVLALVVVSSSLVGCGDVTDSALEDTATLQQGLNPVAWPIGQQTSPAGANYLDPSRCYHTPGSGAHKPGGGYLRADELYAIDVNCQNGSEGGKPVHPIASGTVRQIDRTGLGFVLVEHATPITVDGVTWPRFFTGYMHMATIPSTLVVGSAVTTASQLGVVSSVGAGGAIHLHFIAYVGSSAGEGGATTNGNLISFNPALLGGPFAPFDYVGAGYIWARWVDDTQSSGAFQFVAFGTPGDLFSTTSCGIRGNSRYTTSKTGAADNGFEMKINAATPTRGGYYAWPFVPRCDGTTTTAPYALRAGTSTTTSAQGLLKSWSTNQLNLVDQYDRRAKITIEAGQFTTLTLNDSTGETGKKVAADHLLLFRKTDHCLGGCSFAPASEQGFCLQSDYSTSTSATSCPASTSVPAGY